MDPRATLPVVIPLSTLFKAAKVQNNRILPVALFGGFSKLGVPVWGSHIKDCNIWGSILGSPCLGKLPFDGSRRLVATGPGTDAKTYTALDVGFRASSVEPSKATPNRL